MKNVLVDIDDTLSDTQVAMLAYVNTKSTRPYSYDAITRDYREKAGSEYDRLVHDFLADPGLVKEIKPYANTLATLANLHSAGYTIHIASSRREHLHDVTLEWLRQHRFADYITEIHPRSSSSKGSEFKRQIATKIQPVAAFDDTYEVCEVLAETNVEVYMIDKPWNAGEELPANVIRTGSFADAVKCFLEDQAT